MWRRRSVNGVTLAAVLTALFCAAVLGYIAAIHQTSANADGTARKYVLNVGPVHLNLTVGVMGVLVIFIMTILLALAMGFALIASYRRKQAEAANRELLREVSERKRAQHEVSKLNADLERRMVERTAQLDAANKELEAFSYSVAHDLRDPLRQIGGFAQILVDEYGPVLDSAAQHYLKMVQDGSRNMGQLVDDLLRLGRIGRQELACRPTDLKSLVESVVQDLRLECGERKIEWRIGTLPPNDCDPGLMKQVFINLPSNAVKYTQHRTTAVIEVDSMTPDAAPIFFVRDNGAGFDQRYAHKLFGVFQRLHHAEEFEGTGVGLAIAQRIIQKHGGSIWAEAEVDKGATFFFTLADCNQSSVNATKSAAAGGP